MKYLGIDFGTKRIGLALSDDGGTLAFPKEIIPNNKDTVSVIGDIIDKEKIEEIVIGESLDLSGMPNKLAKDTDLFIVALTEKYFLPIHKQKEFLTSVEARKAGESKRDYEKSESHSRMKKEKGDKVDGSAAALILQRYLDQINQK
jgi:putative Holliday junction resolvase